MARVPVAVAQSGRRCPQISLSSGSAEIPLRGSRSNGGPFSPRTDVSPEPFTKVRALSPGRHVNSSAQIVNGTVLPSVGVVNAGCRTTGVSSAAIQTRRAGYMAGAQAWSGVSPTDSRHRLRAENLGPKEATGRCDDGGSMQQAKMSPHCQQVPERGSIVVKLELQMYRMQRDVQLQRSEFRKEVDRLETEIKAMRDDYHGVVRLLEEVHQEVKRLGEFTHTEGATTTRAGQADHAQLLDAPLLAIREEVASALKLVEKERDLLAISKSNELSARSQADAETLASIRSYLKKNREEMIEEQIHYEQRLVADLSAEMREMEDALRADWENRHNEAYSKVLNMVATCIETCQQDSDGAQVVPEKHSCAGCCECAAGSAQRLLEPGTEALGNDVLQSISDREFEHSEPVACFPRQGPDVASQ